MNPGVGGNTMIESRPSRTAERVAIRRAAHQLLDAPRVHDDPLSLGILGDDQAAAMRANPRRFEDGRVAPVLRAFLAVRRRLAEDALAQAVGGGVRQYVVLGAGLAGEV
jgi:O-methyltransferase involved in polyketide biosynthesis